MADELPIEESADIPDVPQNIAEDYSGADGQEQASPLSDRQKMIFFAFVLLSTLALAAISGNISENIAELRQTDGIQPTATPVPRYPYEDRHMSLSFMIPLGWTVETPGSVSLDFIALKPEASGIKCFPQLDTCPIMIELKPNPKGAPPEQFGTPFYPVPADIQGGQDSISIGAYTATVLYNIKGSGGRIIYIPRSGDIIKITLQAGSAGAVTLTYSAIFDNFLNSINFSK